MSIFIQRKSKLSRILFLACFLFISYWGFGQCKTNLPINVSSSTKGRIILNGNSIHKNGQTYLWEPKTNLSCTDCISPIYTYEKDTIIIFSCTVFDENLKCIEINQYKPNYKIYTPPLDVEEVYLVQKQDTIPNFVDEEAFFAGYKDFLVKNLKYPEGSIEDAISGKCYLRFIVSNTGVISNVKVIKGVSGCPECDQEAIRIIKLMPAWTPAKLNGKNVTSYFNLSISFNLN